MAKDTTKTKNKSDKPAPEVFDYGVDELAAELGIKPASVRVRLRNEGIDKAGKSYGWKTEKEFKAVVAQLKTEPKEKKD